jgi:hypothetical protein
VKFKIGDAFYDAGALEDLSLSLLLRLENETKEFGRPLRMADIQRMTTEIAALKTDAERGQHPDAPWVTAVAIWAARRLAGQDVTFEQAVDFPMSQLTILADPQDRVGPQKPRPRKGSGAAGKHPRTRTTKTSEPQSTVA